MKNKIFTITISLIIVSFLFSSASAFGESIKARMKARLPVIVELKEKASWEKIKRVTCSLWVRRRKKKR